MRPVRGCQLLDETCCWGPQPGSGARCASMHSTHSAHSAPILWGPALLLQGSGWGWLEIATTANQDPLSTTVRAFSEVIRGLGR
jgi:hypothetical protein